MSCDCCQKICLGYTATREAAAAAICGYWDSSATKWYRDKTTHYFFKKSSDNSNYATYPVDRVHTTLDGVVAQGDTCTEDTSTEPDTPVGYYLDHTTTSYSDEITDEDVTDWCLANLVADDPIEDSLEIDQVDWYLYRNPDPPTAPAPSMVAYNIVDASDPDAYVNAGGIIRWTIVWTQTCTPMDVVISYQQTEFPVSGGSSVIGPDEILVPWQDDSDEFVLEASANCSRRFDFLAILAPR